MLPGQLLQLHAELRSICLWSWGRGGLLCRHALVLQALFLQFLLLNLIIIKQISASRLRCTWLPL
jgi:hypothetical protein